MYNLGILLNDLQGFKLARRNGYGWFTYDQQGNQRAQRQPTFETKFQRTARASGPEVKITLTLVSMLSMNLRTVYFQIVTLNALYFFFH